ncbi:MAG: DUF2911 domain-containing protein [Saprospiraceae bacterium]
MKKVLLTLTTLMVLAVFQTASAQIKTPAPSPFCKLTQTAGLTDITVEYSRPGVKGRTIFGGLLPWGELWRTGANKNTTVTFSDKVTIAGKELKAGTYALYTVPNPDEWEVIFYTDADNWGTPENYDASKEAVRFKVKPQELPFSVESFVIDVGTLRDNSCTIALIWEKTLVEFEVGLNTDEVVTAAIKKTMAGPGANDYYAAGRYYMESGKDMKQAHEWLHKANEMNPRFWTLRQEALCLAKMGSYPEAIKVAEKSKQLATEAGNKEYERMNTESIAEWQKM